MAKRVTYRWQVFDFIATAGFIVFGVGLLLAASPRLQIVQAQPTTAAQPDSPLAGTDLAVVSVEVKDKTIQFGDALDIVVTLQNQGKEPIIIPADALILKNEGWAGFPGGGSGLGETPMIRAGYFSKDAFTLQPGESVAMTGSNVEVAVHSMGPMKAKFVIETENGSLAKALGKPPAFTVSYSVTPSKLIAAAWAARTSAERQRLQSEFREILLLGAKETGWRDRFFAENTLTFMGCYAMPLLESAVKDSDPVVRQQATSSLSHTAWSAGELNAFTDDLVKQKETLAWLASIGKCDENHALKESLRLAIAGLNDSDARVRVAAISALTERAVRESYERAYLASHPNMDEQEKRKYDTVGLIDPAIPLVQKMTADTDPSVRAEAQKFLSVFAAQPKVAGNVAASLADADSAVRKRALEALKKSPEPPPMATIEKAFASATGDVGLGLIELMFEREDAELAIRLTPGFKDRTPAERLMILTAIAGHTDEVALKLIQIGLKDTDANVRRAALMRLLGFPSAQALSLLKAASADLSSQERDLAAGLQKEIETRTLFPFLGRRAASASESLFPSKAGTGPLVSPDGKWVAYVETGWGRPGGSGGMGRSNLLSVTHVVGADGTVDRIVSDMFLVGWMLDSRRLASARDGFAAITDLNGKVVKEFGEPLAEPYVRKGFGGEVWPKGDLRSQLGIGMPHTKGFQRNDPDPRTVMDLDYGEDAAFSPDGQSYGPRRVKDKWQFIDADGQKIEMNVPADASHWGSRAIWSPDGAHIIIIPLHPSNSGGRSEIIEPRKAFIIDFLGQAIQTELEVDQVPWIGGWDYRKGRWNPWSKDGKHLAFIRQGQVWVADGEGGNARQVTFDAANKVFPTFSPDGRKLAYITWQYDERRGYSQLGPTDLWVIDLSSGLAARVTHADTGRIEDVDWLGNDTLIFDRMAPGERDSSLRTASLR